MWSFISLLRRKTENWFWLNVWNGIREIIIFQRKNCHYVEMSKLQCTHGNEQNSMPLMRRVYAIFWKYWKNVLRSDDLLSKIIWNLKETITILKSK